MFFNSLQLTVYNGESPYAIIDSVDCQKVIETIIQLSDLSIASFIYGLDIQCFSFNDNKIRETFSMSGKNKFWCKMNFSHIQATEINDNRILCAGFRSDLLLI